MTCFYYPLGVFESSTLPLEKPKALSLMKAKGKSKRLKPQLKYLGAAS